MYAFSLLKTHVCYLKYNEIQIKKIIKILAMQKVCKINEVITFLEIRLKNVSFYRARPISVKHSLNDRQKKANRKRNEFIKRVAKFYMFIVI